VSVFSFRQYDAARDQEPALALWLRTWQKAYPDIDFASRLAWWRDHWLGLAVAHITVAEAKDKMIGFVTVDPDTLYLEQIVVAPEYWGTGLAGALIAEARRLSPRGLDLNVNTDNARAIAFYRRRASSLPAMESIRSAAGRSITCAGGHKALHDSPPRACAVAASKDLPSTLR
jgi:putative acetyltransferase